MTAHYRHRAASRIRVEGRTRPARRAATAILSLLAVLSSIAGHTESTTVEPPESVSERFANAHNGWNEPLFRDAESFQVAVPSTPDGDPLGCGADGICVINGCQQTPDPDCPSLPTVKSLGVSRYATSVLDNATADAILDKATQTLQTDNGSGDVPCDVVLARNGGVTSFSTGDGSIDSQAEFNTVIGLAGDVKIVNQITWCGGFGAGILGCAPQPGASFVAVRWSTLHQEGIIWAHEYGHNQGLPHRSGDVVMKSSVAGRNTRVNSTECDAYRN